MIKPIYKFIILLLLGLLSNPTLASQQKDATGSVAKNKLKLKSKLNGELCDITVGNKLIVKTFHKRYDGRLQFAGKKFNNCY